ncbi:tyrosine-type recombinase/integrase [Knoellia koreensis]|uniref:tyrosine-type recombinase/integrase n=1 Tax=Knoellia koreensis TaxID=2730921 RepID=UPI0014880437
MSRTRSANGRSSIYKDSAGTWHGWVTMGRDDNGKLVRRHVRGRTRASVTERVADLERERASTSGRAAANGRQTLGDWLEEWLVLIKRSRKPRTFSTYDALIRTHCQQLKKVKLHDVTVRQIDDLLDHVATTVSATTAGNLHRTLRAAFSVAVRRGLVASNPCRYATVPRVSHTEVHPLSVREVHDLLTVASGARNAARWSVALALGLRQGESLGLRWEDVDLESGTLAVRRQLQRHPWEHGCAEDQPGHTAAKCPRRHSGGLRFDDTKTGAGRRVLAIPPQMLPQLLDHRRAQAAERLKAGSDWQDLDLVFPRLDGSPTDPRHDHRAWKSLLARAGIRDARLHDARHTAATLLLAQGVDGRVVMSLMGWSQAVLLTRYQHVIDTMRIDAALKIGSAIWGESGA